MDEIAKAKLVASLKVLSEQLESARLTVSGIVSQLTTNQGTPVINVEGKAHSPYESISLPDTAQENGGAGTLNGQTPSPSFPNQDSQMSNDVSLADVAEGRDVRTTLMIRNIPNKYTQKMMLRLIDQSFKGSYDFFYLPVDLKNKCNVGYAFINFINSKESIPRLVALVDGKRWDRYNSEKVCRVTYARLQGIDALTRHFRDSSVMMHNKQVRPFFIAPGSAGSSTGQPKATDSHPGYNVGWSTSDNGFGGYMGYNSDAASSVSGSSGGVWARMAPNGGRQGVSGSLHNYPSSMSDRQLSASILSPSTGPQTSPQPPEFHMEGTVEFALAQGTQPGAKKAAPYVTDSLDDMILRYLSEQTANLGSTSLALQGLGEKIDGLADDPLTGGGSHLFCPPNSMPNILKSSGLCS